MTEKKTRLYKVAKEFNLSHDTLIDFLVKKGCDVKNHMSIIDEGMMELIERHYKKEKVDAERHARKRKEFDELDKKRRGDEKEPGEDDELQPPAAHVPPAEVVEIPQVEEVTVESADIVAEVIEEAAPVVEPVAVIEEIPEPEPAVIVEETAPVIEEVAPAAAPDVTVEAPVAEVPEPVIQAEATAPVVVAEVPAETEAEMAEKKADLKKKAKREELDVSLEASMPKMRGLTVMGKIDLAAAAAALEKKKEVKTGTTAGTDDAGPKRKKKKKKKELPGAKPVVEESLDKKLARKAGNKRGGVKVKEVDQAEVASAIKKTIASMSDFGASSQRSNLRKRKRARREVEQMRESEIQEREKRILRIYEYATVSEIATLMNVGVGQVISALRCV